MKSAFQPARRILCALLASLMLAAPLASCVQGDEPDTTVGDTTVGDTPAVTDPVTEEPTEAPTEAETEAAGRIAARYALLPSGGSDFHGDRKPGIALGRGRGNLFIPYHFWENLRP